MQGLLHAASGISKWLEYSRKYRREGKGAEQVLIYQMLIGMGLRSTELSLLVPNQVDFDRCRLRVEAANTKNKKADVLPLRSELAQALKAWVESHVIQSDERIFLLMVIRFGGRSTAT